MVETTPVSVYWDGPAWQLARSAYVADLDTVPDGPGSFVAWLQDAVERHAARSPAARARLATDLPAVSDERGFQRAHPLPPATVEAFEQAILADRQQTGRVLARSAFIREAVLLAAATARQRYGRDLPSVDGRLPTRPVRRRTL